MFFIDFELLVLKIINDYDPVIFWSYESDCDCIRHELQAADSLYAAWEAMGAIMSLQSIHELAEDLYNKSTCISPAVQLSLDFTYD